MVAAPAGFEPAPAGSTRKSTPPRDRRPSALGHAGSESSARNRVDGRERGCRSTALRSARARGMHVPSRGRKRAPVAVLRPRPWAPRRRDAPDKGRAFWVRMRRRSAFRRAAQTASETHSGERQGLRLFRGSPTHALRHDGAKLHLDLDLKSKVHSCRALIPWRGTA